MACLQDHRALLPLTALEEREMYRGILSNLLKEMSVPLNDRDSTTALCCLSAIQKMWIASGHRMDS